MMFHLGLISISSQATTSEHSVTGATDRPEKLTFFAFDNNHASLRETYKASSYSQAQGRRRGCIETGPK
jgi:hypothetical protein